MKKYSPTSSSIEYLNIDILYSFSLVKDEGREWLSKLCIRYRKTVGKHKDIEIDFYSNDSLNDDLDNPLNYRLVYFTPQTISFGSNYPLI